MCVCSRKPTGNHGFSHEKEGCPVSIFPYTIEYRAEIMVLGGYGADAGATTEVLDLEAWRKEAMMERTMNGL